MTLVPRAELHYQTDPVDGWIVLSRYPTPDGELLLVFDPARTEFSMLNSGEGLKRGYGLDRYEE